MKESEKALIGVIEPNEDLRILVTSIIEEAGFQTICEDLSEIAKDRAVYKRFLVKHDPKVLVISVPNPYFPSNWKLITDLMTIEEAQGRGFVLATSVPAYLKNLLAEITTLQQIEKTPYRGRLKILEEPFEITTLTQAVIGCYQALKDPPSHNLNTPFGNSNFP